VSPFHHFQKIRETIFYKTGDRPAVGVAEGKPVSGASRVLR
jgi:hypothetical protein